MDTLDCDFYVIGELPPQVKIKPSLFEKLKPRGFEKKYGVPYKYFLDRCMLYEGYSS